MIGININDLANCRNRIERFFVFQQNDPAQMDSLIDMMQNDIPDSSYVLIYSWVYLDLNNWNASHLSTFSNYGFAGIFTAPDSVPCILFVQKGAPATALELYGNSPDDSLQLVTPINCTVNGTPELLTQEEIHLYPNPTTGIVNLSNVTGSVEVFNITGRLLLTSKDSQVNLSILPKGIYMVKTGDGTRKVVLH